MLFVRGSMCLLLQVVCVVFSRQYVLFVRGDMHCVLLQVVCVVCYRWYVLYVRGNICCLLEAVCVVC